MSRKYKEYKNLSDSLRRDGIPYPGKVATILLDAFIYTNGHLKAPTVVAKGLCVDGRFKIWVKNLEHWIIKDDTSDSYTKYRCTEKLLKYINRERQRSFLVATSDEVEQAKKEAIEESGKKIATVDASLRAELRAQDERIKNLEQTMNEVIEVIDPPSNERKRKKLQRGEYRETLRLVRQHEPKTGEV
jgi:hypothetical protein